VSGAGDVDAIVLAAGQGDRLGLGPKAWLALGGRTLLERAVATMRLVTDHVIVGVAAGDLDRARGVRRRCRRGPAAPLSRDDAAACAGAGVVLIHDVAHPFVTPALARAVIEAAHGRGAAVAAVVATSSAYRHARGTAPVRLAGAGDVWLVRRPFVFRRADFARALETARGDEGLSLILGRGRGHQQWPPRPGTSRSPRRTTGGGSSNRSGMG
jgi:2-C-methyl-D-erythritol 4-phosphate cytidylyltransferase